jgi:hypothetical protein
MIWALRYHSVQNTHKSRSVGMFFFFVRLADYLSVWFDCPFYDLTMCCKLDSLDASVPGNISSVPVAVFAKYR